MNSVLGFKLISVSLVSVLSMLLFSYSSFAGEVQVLTQNGACSQWQKQDSVSCVFAGRSANVYQRQCENTCFVGHNGQGNWGPQCDVDYVCYPTDPSLFEGACSRWEPVHGTTCYDPNTQRWAQSWQRACTVGLSEQWCSPDYPSAQ